MFEQFSRRPEKHESAHGTTDPRQSRGVTQATWLCSSAAERSEAKMGVRAPPKPCSSRPAGPRPDKHGGRTSVSRHFIRDCTTAPLRRAHQERTPLPGNGAWDYTPPDPFDNESLTCGDVRPTQESDLTAHRLLRAELHGRFRLFPVAPLKLPITKSSWRSSATCLACMKFTVTLIPSFSCSAVRSRHITYHTAFGPKRKGQPTFSTAAPTAMIA